MMRATPMEAPDRRLALHVEGTLSGPWVRELQVVCDKALAERRPITLDLLGVTFVDREGAKLLRTLDREQGVELANLSTFVTQVLGRDLR
jgi:anti-anti-sigma regulatory factor